MSISTVSSLLKQVMTSMSLQQKDLAVVLDVPLDRVKSLTSGKVKKLSSDETRRLVQTLNLSAHWLATGEGPMFDAQGGQALGRQLSQLRMCSAAVNAMGLMGEVGAGVRDIAYGVAINNSDVVLSGVAILQPALPQDEQVLLDSYRRCNAEARNNLIQTAALLSAGIPVIHQPTPRRQTTPKRTENIPQSVNMTNHAVGGVQIGVASNKVRTKVVTQPKE